MSAACCPPSLRTDLQQLACDVVARRRPAVIAVDGVDGAGKTTFASRLAAAIEAAGRPAVIVHEDDFLAPKEIRYGLGRDSPEGYFRDSYDLTALIERVLDPLRPGADRRIQRRVFDHLKDAPAAAPTEEVAIDAVVIVEGMFLHRDELVARWDWSVFLDVPFTVTARRMAQRDGSHPDPDHPSLRRYVEGQRIYLATCHPAERASVVLDFHDGRLVRSPPAAPRGGERSTMGDVDDKLHPVDLPEPILELERLAALGLPEWSEELTDQVHPVLAELDELMSEDPAVLSHVLDHLEACRSRVVADWLRMQLSPDLSLDVHDTQSHVHFAGVQIPSRPALFLAPDLITVPTKKMRKLKKPWERVPGWFFGRPQESPATDSWPRASDGAALDFIVQIDLAAAAAHLGGLDSTSLPDDITLQVFADLDRQVGAVDHRVLAFPTGAGGAGVMKPLAGSDLNDAQHLPINPVGALTLPRAPDGDIDVDVRDPRSGAFLRFRADQAPYDLNLFRRTDEPAVAPEAHATHVPMARLGGYPILDPAIWTAPAQEALGCDADEMFVLYDGPVDPEPRPVADPDRNRIMVLIQRSRLTARDFEVTYAIGY